MEMPEGLKTLKKLAKIPVVIEGEKKARLTYTIPEIKIACELMKEMAEANLEAAKILDALGPEFSALKVFSVLNKFKEWK